MSRGGAGPRFRMRGVRAVMSEKVQTILEQIKGLTLLEAAELVKEIE